MCPVLARSYSRVNSPFRKGLAKTVKSDEDAHAETLADTETAITSDLTAPSYIHM